MTEPDYTPSDEAKERVAVRRAARRARGEREPERLEIERDLTAAVPLELQRERERWEAEVFGEDGERWFVAVTEDGRIDRNWPASARYAQEAGEGPPRTLMGNAARIVAVVPEGPARERWEGELRERLTDLDTLRKVGMVRYAEAMEKLLTAALPTEEGS